MKRVKASDFPALKQVFSGYLHEDFVKEYGSATAALRSFEADADDDEVDRFRAEVQRFLEMTEPLDFAKVRTLLTQLGSRWHPASRKSMATVLTGEAAAH